MIGEGLMRRLFLTLALVVIIGLAGGIVLVRHIQQIRLEREQANQAALALKRTDIQVTVPEGKRKEQIALQLQAAGICTAADFLAAAEGQEGFLFPDTYRFFPNTPGADVAAAMRKDFDDKVGDLHPTEAQVILASIVEREAIGDADRAAIAGVYSNRLDIGMRLESDPTVEYAKDTNQLAATGLTASFKFWGEITQDDYHSVESPFNMYLNDGLPPAAIANPGRASIIAAQHPAQHDYIYFLYSKSGVLELSRTLQEHQRKAAAN